MSIRHYCSAALAALLLWPAAGASAHGTECSVSREAVMVEAAYNDGSPMSFCDVEVRKGESGEVVLTGTTDERGRFCFLPDGGAGLEVRIDDGMGHLAEVRVAADGSSAPEDPKRPRAVWPLIAGVGLVFGLAGIYMMIKSGRV